MKQILLDLFKESIRKVSAYKHTSLTNNTSTAPSPTREARRHVRP
jgi:hypothetical protein